MFAVHEIGYQNQAAPLTVLGSVEPWGQVHHGAVAINDDEIIEELEGRGYSIEEAVHHVPAPPVAPSLTRAGAKRIGVDTAIDVLVNAGYTIPHNNAHPRICDKNYGCPLPKPTWDALVTTSRRYAEYYMQGGTLPNWVQPEHMAGLYGAYGYLGQDIPFGPPAPAERPGLFDRHPWLLGMIGGIFTGLGSVFTAKMLAADLRKVLPEEGLSAQDKLELRQMMLSLAPPGTESKVGDAVTQATGTPSWLIPVMIGGVIFLVLIMIMKK